MRTTNHRHNNSTAHHSSSLLQRLIGLVAVVGGLKHGLHSHSRGRSASHPSRCQTGPLDLACRPPDGCQHLYTATQRHTINQHQLLPVCNTLLNCNSHPPSQPTQVGVQAMADRQSQQLVCPPCTHTHTCSVAPSACCTCLPARTGLSTSQLPSTDTWWLTLLLPPWNVAVAAAAASASPSSLLSSAGTGLWGRLHMHRQAGSNNQAMRAFSGGSW